MPAVLTYKQEHVLSVLREAYPNWMTAGDIAKTIDGKHRRQWADARSVSNVLKGLPCIESKSTQDYYPGASKQYRYTGED